MTAIQAVALYTGLNLLILMVLALLVARARGTFKIGLGDGGHEGMLRVIRAHANGAEWVPGALIGLLVAAQMGIPAYAIHIVGIALTIGRLAHAWGLSNNAGRSAGRMVGTLLTLLVYLALALGLIGHAIF